MSLHQTILTVQNLLKDPTVGLAAQTTALVTAYGVTSNIRSDFRFPDWTLSENAKPSMQPSVTIIPTGWKPMIQMVPNQPREADVSFDIGYEVFDGKELTIRQSISIVSAALTICLDNLVNYSQIAPTLGVTVKQVYDPLTFRYGTYPGKGRGGNPVTNGFICSLTLQEWSSYAK